jgi:hypothetical protein
VNHTTNQVTFNTSHFSTFALMIINSPITITFVSPQDGLYASVNPLISVKASNTFSFIRDIKVDIDGTDMTAILNAQAATDGIDNNLNGVIDEKGGNDLTTIDDEQAFTLASDNSATFIARSITSVLKNGEHSLKVTVINQEGQTASQTITFNTGSQLTMVEPHNYPNPFNPSNVPTGITAPTYICPNITTAALVKVKIYDFAGNEVASLTKQIYNQSDFIEWDGKDAETKKYLANGVYFAKIEADSGTQTVKKFIKIAILR